MCISLLCGVCLVLGACASATMATLRQAAAADCYDPKWDEYEDDDRPEKLDVQSVQRLLQLA